MHREEEEGWGERGQDKGCTGRRRRGGVRGGKIKGAQGGGGGVGWGERGQDKGCTGRRRRGGVRGGKIKGAQGGGGGVG